MRAANLALRAVQRTRALRERVRRRFDNRGFRRDVLDTRPVPVKTIGPIEVRTFFGRRSILEGIAALKSFYRFAPERYPLVVHEDGTFRREDGQLLRKHFPGARIISREIADRDVIHDLENRGFAGCASLRRRFVLAMKFFDLLSYGADRRILYMDSDVLFLQSPDVLFEYLHGSDSGWKDHFAADIHTCYSWPTEALKAMLGVPMLPLVNSGLMLFSRHQTDWSLAESVLAIPMLPNSSHYAEQTLFAVEFSRVGATPLPPEYDVCFRNTWKEDYERWLAHAETGHEVISQHYCGGARQRTYFYRHFVRYVAPALLRTQTASQAGGGLPSGFLTSE